MTIKFEAKVIKIEEYKLIPIPISESEKLPSRGMVMINGQINGIDFVAPLEPDGKGSHWLEVNKALNEKLNLAIGDDVLISMEPTDQWIEPEIPQDFIKIMEGENVLDRWNNITIKAKWDWIRWIRGTKSEETRNKRMEVACSKLKNGDKRPCCFDRTRCTQTDVSKSGVLLD